MIDKKPKTTRVAAADLYRLRELQRKIRKDYPYISEVQVQRWAWKAYLKEKGL